MPAKKVATKTKPTGVRFDQDLLDHLKKTHGIKTPQQALNFLTEHFLKNIAVLVPQGHKDAPVIKKAPVVENRFLKERQKKLFGDTLK